MRFDLLGLTGNSAYSAYELRNLKMDRSLFRVFCVWSTKISIQTYLLF